MAKDEFTRGWLECIASLREEITKAEQEGRPFELDVELMLAEDLAHESLRMRGLTAVGGRGGDGVLRYTIKPQVHLLH